MHTDIPPKEKPTGSANNPAGRTDSASVPKAVFRIKAALIRSAAWLAVIVRGLA
jgi:hypothetical protein